MSGGFTAAAVAAPKEDIRIVSYNVLSSGLCEPSYYTRCKPEDLAPETRLKRVSTILERETQQQAVICLQEVSQDWLGPLSVFFASKGYTLTSALYGYRKNNYMGVAIAWPNALELKRLEHKRLADLLPEVPRKEDPPFLTALWHRLFPPEKPFDVAAESARRYNVVIFAEFAKNKIPFTVATYHMPCLFGSVAKEQVMVVHAAKLAHLVHDFANDNPYVLAGDFNIKPKDPCYDMLTKNQLPTDYVPPDSTGFSMPPTSLVSAYADKVGAEPELTNFAFSRNQKEPFVGTLDYIFLSKSWTVNDVKPTPRLSQINLASGSFPDATQPSDHVPIAADLAL